MATSFVLRSTALLEAAAGTGALLAGLLILLVPVLVIFDVVVLRSLVVLIFVLPEDAAGAALRDAVFLATGGLT